MSITLTLFMQMITFFIFVLLMMKFVWPPISQVLEARRKNIADGLAAADRGRHDLEVAQHKVKELILEAKAQATVIVEQANQRAHQIEEAAREDGRHIVEHMKIAAETELEQEANKVREELRDMVADLVVSSTEKLLHKHIDAANSKTLINKWVDEI